MRESEREREGTRNEGREYVAKELLPLPWQSAQLPLRADVRSRTNDHVQSQLFGYLDKLCDIQYAREVKLARQGLMQVPGHIPMKWNGMESHLHNHTVVSAITYAQTGLHHVWHTY